MLVDIAASEDHLQGDSALRMLLLGLEDDPHAAFADLADDTVVADLGGRRYWSGRNRHLTHRSVRNDGRLTPDGVLVGRTRLDSLVVWPIWPVWPVLMGDWIARVTGRVRHFYSDCKRCFFTDVRRPRSDGRAAGHDDPAVCTAIVLPPRRASHARAKRQSQFAVGGEIDTVWKRPPRASSLQESNSTRTRRIVGRAGIKLLTIAPGTRCCDSRRKKDIVDQVGRQNRVVAALSPELSAGATPKLRVDQFGGCVRARLAVVPRPKHLGPVVVTHSARLKSAGNPTEGRQKYALSKTRSTLNSLHLRLPEFRRVRRGDDRSVVASGDTNVLSAPMRAAPVTTVVRWLDRQPADSIWVTNITVFEARFGLSLLPKGRKRMGLEHAFDRVLSEDLAGRVVDFDSAGAVAAARLAADRQRMGRVADLRDTLIAGIAQVRRATIATRNTKRFEGLDVPVVDPWRA